LRLKRAEKLDDHIQYSIAIVVLGPAGECGSTGKRKHRALVVEKGALQRVVGNSCLLIRGG
jgi:hypothetical protein